MDLSKYGQLGARDYLVLQENDIIVDINVNPWRLEYFFLFEISKKLFLRTH